MASKYIGSRDELSCEISKLLKDKPVKDFNSGNLKRKSQYIARLGCHDTAYDANEILKKRTQEEIIDLSEKIIKDINLTKGKRPDLYPESENLYSKALFQKYDLYILKKNYYEHKRNPVTYSMWNAFTLPEIFACFALIKINTALNILVKLEKLVEENNFNIKDEKDHIKISVIFGLVHEATKAICYTEEIIHCSRIEANDEEFISELDEKLKNHKKDFRKAQTKSAGEKRHQRRDDLVCFAVSLAKEIKSKNARCSIRSIAFHITPQVMEKDMMQNGGFSVLTSEENAKYTVYDWLREHKEKLN